MTKQLVDRQAYLNCALPQIAQILQLLDRNPLSPTYGCFDRQYWHYRALDFPCGMSQEFVYPLALVFSHPFSGNPYYQQPRIREWALAGIDFARKSSHRDGSCDDYYPFERALGATVFSLYAMAETMLLLSDEQEDRIAFLRRRAHFAATASESGVLTNHHAIAAASLFAAYQVTKDPFLKDAAARKAQEVLAHQHEEGWYREYEGFDPGYQTVTVDFLARYVHASGDRTPLPSLQRAVQLLEKVQHPDGTFGGEYGSRNTYHALPHGFELLSNEFPEARRVADRLLMAFNSGLRARNDDDRLVAHHVYPCLLAYLDFAERIADTTPRDSERIYLPGCGFLVERGPRWFLIAGLSKGGPYRLYDGDKLVANDSGPALVLKDGTVLVSHLGHAAQVQVAEGAVTSTSEFSRSARERMTPFKMIVLRVLMLTVGRFFRNTVRRLLQRRLITGRNAAPFRHTRRFHFSSQGIEVEDTLERLPGAPVVEGIRLGVGQTSVYIAASHPWDAGWLLPWTDLDHLASEFNERGSITHRSHPTQPAGD
ncbi:MAG TPA: hypothetical protein PKA37_02955 [Planctomycetota bacterium]|nr:hypothetical protein [Planctomycetota bacterium]